MPGTLAKLPVQTVRKVGMTSNHHGPYVWATHVLQWPVQRAATTRVGAIYKTGLSSDRSLQLDCVKLESLVIAYQL